MAQLIGQVLLCVNGSALPVHPTFAPGFDWSGTECPGVVQTAEGTLLLTQSRGGWYPLAKGAAAPAGGRADLPGAAAARLDRGVRGPVLAACAAHLGARLPGLYVHRSADGGRTCQQTARIAEEIALRDDLPNGDLGYPAMVGSQDSRLYALDAHNGRQFWIFAAAGWVESSPAVSGGVVYVGSNDGRLYALDMHTGANRASPVVTRAPACIAAANRLIALDLAGQTPRWEYATPSFITSSPALVAATLDAASEEGTLHALDAATGDFRWQFRTGGKITASPAVADGVLFIGVHNGKLYAVE